LALIGVSVSRFLESDLVKPFIVIILAISLMTAGIAQDLGWPREKVNSSGKLTYYQPQFDEWKDFRRLEARMAVSYKPVKGDAVLGVVAFRARTDANVETRNVVISRMEIISVHFPAVPAEKAAALEAAVRQFLPANAILNINLDRLLAELEESKPASTPAVAVKNDPPQIFVAYDTAILLLVDGEPVRAPIEKTGLEVVINTNWNLFFDTAGSQYYLLNGRQWLMSSRRYPIFSSSLI
jgi:hypothetical protein